MYMCNTTTIIAGHLPATCIGMGKGEIISGYGHTKMYSYLRRNFYRPSAFLMIHNLLPLSIQTIPSQENYTTCLKCIVGV